MEPQEGEDDYNQSVISLISAFCRHLSGDIQHVDAEAIELHQRSLRRIAYTHLLNQPPRTTEGDHLESKDVALALFTFLAIKKLSNNQWTYSEFGKACAFIEKIEKRLNCESVPSWVWNMGRMLIALELYRPQPATSSTRDSRRSTALRCMDGLSYIPKAFQLCSYKFLSHELNDGKFVWTNFKYQLPKLQLPMRIDTIRGTRTHRIPIEQNDPAIVLPRSTSQGDEGFSSLTDAVTRWKPLNWSLVPTSPKKRYLEWESFSIRPEDLDAKTRTTYCEMSSPHFRKSRIDFLVANSIEYPLEAQTRVIRNLGVHKPFIENDLMVHLKILRDFFLKNNGSGARIFANMLSEHIEQIDPQAFSVHHTLHNILSVAYPMESKFLALKSDYVPQALDPTNPYVFSFLRLGYQNYWPLDLVLTDMALLRYNEAFDFLTSIDITLAHLQKVFLFLRVKILEFRGENYKQIQLERHVMLTFVTSLKSYTGSMVTLWWNQMYSELLTVQDSEQLCRIHVRFLQNLHSSLLLFKTTERIQECLAKALHYILVYCRTLFHSDWDLAANGECVNSKYKKLAQSFEKFVEIAGSCQKCVNYLITEHGHAHLNVLNQFIF